MISLHLSKKTGENLRYPQILPQNRQVGQSINGKF